MEQLKLFQMNLTWLKLHSNWAVVCFEVKVLDFSRKQHELGFCCFVLIYIVLVVSILFGSLIWVLEQFFDLFCVMLRWLYFWFGSMKKKLKTRNKDLNLLCWIDDNYVFLSLECKVIFFFWFTLYIFYSLFAK